MRPSLCLKIDSDLESVGLVAKAVRALCSNGLGPEALDEVELGVAEAINNVIKHGYAGRKGSSVEIRAVLSIDRVVIDILDQAPAMPQTALEARDPWSRIESGQTEDLPESGMGMALIQMTMDEVSYSSDAGINQLRLTKLLAH
ncbi:ATP-binding protein [Devosia submarina]|uniref:ATP-binding protein n=1 Tax=Devosia submarina TaxID=1173082 RepID=UPI000D3B4D86|nr:ATP-binding protein [Devosia submarina]